MIHKMLHQVDALVGVFGEDGVECDELFAVMECGGGGGVVVIVVDAVVEIPTFVFNFSLFNAKLIVFWTMC